MYGNINATTIGDYENPKVRLTGSGGANDIASLCQRVIFMGLHLPERFPSAATTSPPPATSTVRGASAPAWWAAGPGGSSPTWDSWASTRRAAV